MLFLHGATAPSTCDFDLSYKDYSWADWMVKRDYVVYMGDYRNYVKIIKADVQIDALDPDIKLFVREKMAEGNTVLCTRIALQS